MARRVVLLDTETTGFSPQWDRVVEVCAVEVEPRTGRLGRELHRYVNPLRSIPDDAIEVHGLTAQRLRNEPPFRHIAGELCAFLDGAVVAMHNSSFDTTMLNAELLRAGKPPLVELNVSTACTLRAAQNIYPLLRSHTLDALCDYLGINRTSRTVHGARSDVRLLAQALPKMAADYDAWMAMDERSCAADVDALEGELKKFCDALLGKDAQSADETERLFLRVSTALRWAQEKHGEAVGRYVELVGEEDWLCKHFFARWFTTNGTAWKAAAQELIPNVRLDRYTTAVTSTSVRVGKPDERIALKLASLERFLPRAASASAHCAVRTAMVLDRAADRLAEGKQALRERLLAHVDDGFAPARCTVRSSSSKRINYQRAVKERVPAAIYEAFGTSSSAPRLRIRSARASQALFAASP